MAGNPMFGWLFSQCCCQELPHESVRSAGIEQVGVFNGDCVSCDLMASNVTYASDVEGRWEYFCNFVDHSKGLNFRVDMEHAQRRGARDLDLDLEENWHFVFGGDACVKGPGTLRFLETMVRLKKRWPNRVHLLLGEDDLNIANWTEDLNRDFDVRRQELAHVAGVKSQDSPCRGGPCVQHYEQEISDDEVVKSYEDSLKPGGWVWEYLQLAQLGVRLGDTLFIYGEILTGGISVEDVCVGVKHQEAIRLGVVPKDDQLVDDMHAWLRRLNSWAKTRVSKWELSASWDALDETSAYPLPTNHSSRKPGRTKIASS